ncbi:MAG TPA: sn-glycerol-3-phosphate ABC transporter ATP-binding protein UgpC [Burkholderiaceae bacterium]
MAEVRIEGVEKYFGETHVIRGIDVAIADGEFCALVGPSGCGKSTLLRMIAGLETVSRGTISIGSRVVNDLAPRERDVAMVFQNYALYPHMRVRSNLAFSLELARVPRSETDARVRDAARMLGLEELLERLPGQLSGGQRQRVAMGRAIVRRPQVFLFDEPLSNLDAELRVRMRVELKELHQRLQTTAVYVTHDQIEAMTMADTIVVMRDGAIEQTGAPLALYDRPANTFVAGFIGSPAMNLLAARVGIDGRSVDVGELNFPVPDWNAPPGAEVSLGVRPEHLVPGEYGLAAEVTLVEPTGADTLVYCRCASGKLIVVVRDRHAYRPGERITLAPVHGALHVFDAESGRRI